MQLTHDPENKVLGILGMGGIGTAVAKRAIGFGMKLQYHNRHRVTQDKNPFNAKYVGFEELLRTSDIISVHLPLNDGTRGMLGRAEFAMMKEGVVFVNTARGLIVDEGALVEALESGHVWGAGLDVYEREPIVHEGLLRNDHCVLMPHVGTATLDTQRKMEILVMNNLKSAISEGRLVTPVVETRDMLHKNTANGVFSQASSDSTLNEDTDASLRSRGSAEAAGTPATPSITEVNGSGEHSSDCSSSLMFLKSAETPPVPTDINGTQCGVIEIKERSDENDVTENENHGDSPMIHVD